MGEERVLAEPLCPDDVCIQHTFSMVSMQENGNNRDELEMSNSPLAGILHRS